MRLSAFLLLYRGPPMLLLFTTLLTKRAETSGVVEAADGHSIARALQTTDPCNRTFTDKQVLLNVIRDYKSSSCNQDISTWDVSRITDMANLFANVGWAQTDPFNDDLNAWDTSRVTNMARMFASTNFNGKISNWNVGKVTSVYQMFKSALAFNQNLCRWNCSLSSTANIAEMFTNTNCPYQASPNFGITTSFCQSCSQVQCGISFIDGEWSIKQQTTGPLDIIYTDRGADLKLRYTTGIHNVSLSLFGEDCSTAISTTSTTPVIVLGTSPNPVISNQNQITKTQDVTYNISVAASSLTSSNIYSNVTGALKFCARIDLSQEVNGTSLSYFQNLVAVTFNKTGFANFTVNDTALVQNSFGDTANGVVGLNSSLLACVCDPSDATYACSDTSTLALTAGSFLSVCVTVLATKSKIDDVTLFKISQYDTNVKMDAITNSIRDMFTTTTLSSDYKKTRIKTQLVSDFFQGLTAENKAIRKLKAEGTIALRLIDGSRKLIHVSAVILEEDRNRRLNQKRQHLGRQVISSFAVDNILLDESNPEEKVSVLPVRGVVLTACAGLVAIGFCSYFVYLLVARKKKEKQRHMNSKVFLQDHVW